MPTKYILCQKEVERIGAKVDAATLLEKFITNMQRERSEVWYVTLLKSRVMIE